MNNRDIPDMPSVEKPEVVEKKIQPVLPPEPKREEEKPAEIEVEALRAGFFNCERKKEGDRFMVASIEKVGSWMRCLDRKAQGLHEKQMAAKRKKRMDLIEKEKMQRGY